MEEVKVEVWQLVRDKRDRDVLLLRDERGRHLPIWIGPCEAAAIWVKLVPHQANPMVRRPMTHDLCTTIIERLGGRIERIVVDDYSNETYYAKIHLAAVGCEMTIDSRPSDAIAIALRCDAPILVSDDIMSARDIEIEHDQPPSTDLPDEEPDPPFGDDEQ